MKSIPKNTLDNIVKYFNLGKIKKIKFLSSGWANDNFLVETYKNEGYVIRILKNQTKQGLINEYSIQHQLKTINIPTSNFLIKNHTYFYEKNSILSTVSKKINGIHPKKFDKNLLFKIGETLATFHVNITNLPTDTKGWLNPLLVKEELKQIKDVSKKKEIIDLFNTGVKIYDLDLPSGIIHGDLHSENMLIDKGKIAIFDFEASEKNLFILDIALTLIDLFYRKNIYDQNLINFFLEGYESVRRVSQIELNNLNLAVKYDCGAMAAWFYLNNFDKDGDCVIKIGKENACGCF